MKRVSLFVFILLGTVTLLTGCGGPKSIKMAPQERSAIQTVQISANVSRPTELYYYGPGQTVGMMFGAIGGAIAGAASQGPAKTIDSFAIENGVKIENIAYEEVGTALRESGKLKIAQTGDSSATTLNIKVLMFGFSIPNGFSSKYVPIVGIQCDLVDSSGKVVWSANDRVSPMSNPVSPISSETLFNDPKAIESAWRAALHQIATNIVAEL